MRHLITILALSRKWGGRCVAGYDHNENRIVRLVIDRNGKELPINLTTGINTLDTVEVEVICRCPLEHQSENVLIDAVYGLNKVRQANTIEDYRFLKYRDNYVFGNNRAKVNDTKDLDHSFELIEFSNMSIYDEGGKFKADFYVGDTLHRWYRVTDIIHERENEMIPKGYAVITIPPTDTYAIEHGFYKYIAAIYPTIE